MREDLTLLETFTKEFVKGYKKLGNSPLIISEIERAINKYTNLQRKKFKYLMYPKIPKPKPIYNQTKYLKRYYLHHNTQLYLIRKFKDIYYGDINLWLVRFKIL